MAGERERYERGKRVRVTTAATAAARGGDVE